MELRHRAPPTILLPPTGARRHPHRERLSKVLIGMLLRIPTRQVAHVVFRKQHWAIVFAVRPAIWSKQLLPLWRAVQPVSVIESMPCFVAQIHHDFAIGLEIIVLSLNLAEVRSSKIKRNSNHRLARRASPFVSQVNSGPELHDPFLFQLPVKLLHEFFDLRAVHLQPQIADSGRQQRRPVGMWLLGEVHV